MELIRARIRAIREEAQGIRRLEIVASQALPQWSAGAHIDVHLPSGRVRQYSLCSDPGARDHYEFAVQLEEKGRGGSREVFGLSAGDPLAVSPPRNNFPLALNAEHHILVAGGIGITPIVPMIGSLEQRGRSFQVIYCSRTEARTAFHGLALGLAQRGLAVIHHDEGRRERQFDFERALATRPDGAHLYCCGPEGLMQAVRYAARSWPADTIHWEYFSNAAAASRSSDGSFLVRLASSGKLLEIPSDATILETLRVHGATVDSSCESGLCGTCKTRYLEGRPDHRDLVLDEAEKEKFLMICCSRSLSETLVLDL